MPAIIEAYWDETPTPTIEYVFPGELVSISLGKNLVNSTVLLIGCDQDDTCVDLFEVAAPSDTEPQAYDIDELYALCTRENLIGEVRGDTRDFSFGWLARALRVGVEHFYCMTVN